MDEIDKKLMEIVDGAESNDLELRLPKLQPFLAQYGYELKKSERGVTEPPEEPKGLTMSATVLKSNDEAATNEELAAFLDIAASEMLKTYQLGFPIFKRKQGALARDILNLMIRTTSQLILFLQAGTPVDLKAVHADLSKARGLVEVGVMPKTMGIAMAGGARLVQLNAARAHLHLAEVEAAWFAIDVKNSSTAGVAVAVSEMYALTIALYRHYEINL